MLLSRKWAPLKQLRRLELHRLGELRQETDLCGGVLNNLLQRLTSVHISVKFPSMILSVPNSTAEHRGENTCVIEHDILRQTPGPDVIYHVT